VHEPATASAGSVQTLARVFAIRANLAAVERETVQVYEREAQRYRALRPGRRDAGRAEVFAAACRAGLPVADLGCGPGAYLSCLPRPVLAIDAAAAMLQLARQADPDAAALRADVAALPLADRSLGGAWARNSYLHLKREHLPLALARLHWALVPGAPLMISLTSGEGEGARPADDLPGRFFCRWRPPALRDVLTGAGFEHVAVEEDEQHHVLYATARRARTLPDTVGTAMCLLICGLNPSLVAADAGYGFAGPTNRFWRAAAAAGVVSQPRDPLHALLADRVGMTDLAKRATPRASELDQAEYRSGVERVRRLVAWLRPAAVCFVGLDGWRAAIDRRAGPGWQDGGFAGAPAYVMPSTSGLNARTSLDELVAHLRAARAGPVTR
jgi:TDG/mug DNA glycosylase family protein